MIQIYDLYKPLRNYLRKFGALQSLEDIRVLSQNITFKTALPSKFHIGHHHGSLEAISEKIRPWELDLLAREIILNANPKGGLGFQTWKEFAKAINLMRQMDNEISIRKRNQGYDVLLDLHKLTHQQFPTQQPPNDRVFMRYYKIFGGKIFERMLQEKYGLSVEKFITLGILSTGHFLNDRGITTRQDYSRVGVGTVESDNFYAAMKVTFSELRESLQAIQSYDESWAYTWNPMHSTPLINMDLAMPDQVICPLPVLLANRTTRGIFYDVCNSVGFDNAYGLAFQSYVGEVLHRVFQSESHALLDESEYCDGKNRKDGADWKISDAGGHVFIECKTKRLKRESKFAPDSPSLDEDLKILSSAVAQNYKNIDDAVKGKSDFAWNGKPIFNLIITLEDWFMFTPPVQQIFMNHLHDHLIQKGLEVSIIDERPFTIASIEEFELYGQIMAKVGIVEFMSKKTDREFQHWGMFAFANNNYADEFSQIETSLFKSEWAELWQKKLNEFR